MPTVSRPARPSLGWGTVGEKVTIEKVVDKLRNVTALPKYAPISLKFRLPVPWCVFSSAAYSLNWTIPLMMTNRPWYTRRYVSLHGRMGRRLFQKSISAARHGRPSRPALTNFWNKRRPIRSSQRAPARCHGENLHSGERFVKCLTTG